MELPAVADDAFNWLVSVFDKIPLGFLEAWGRFGYFAGLGLALCAFAGITLRPGGRWALGWQRQRWDARAILSIPLTYALVVASGYAGSSHVLVPGVQTFESLKDLAVFLCIVLFGYPALLTVPFAYASSDFVEGVPPEFMLDWWSGYFINPACFWIACQVLGRDPDFRRARTWPRYLVFVAAFMVIQPALWGHVGSITFTPGTAYRSIMPALLLTTAVTWAAAPFAMLAALPLARRLGLFWAAIPGRVREYAMGQRGVVWESGGGAPDAEGPPQRGIAIGFVILVPLLLLVLVLFGATAYVTLQESESAAMRLASRLHHAISDNIDRQLDEYLATRSADDATTLGAIDAMLARLPMAVQGRAVIVDRRGVVIAASGDRRDPITVGVIDNLLRQAGRPARFENDFEFRFDHITSRPLSRQTWFAIAVAYEDRSGGHADWVLITAMPESFYLSGVRAGQSRSAMVFAAALLVSMILAALLASTVAAPLRRMALAIRGPSGTDLPAPLPHSRLAELNALSRAFNDMTARLRRAFDDLRVEAEARMARERELTEGEDRLRRSEDRMQLAVKAAQLGVWDWDIVHDRLTVDDAMRRLFDLPAEEDVGTRAAWTRRLLPEDAARVDAEIDETIRGDRVLGSDFRVRWRDGSIRVMRGAAGTVRDAAGSVVRLVGVMRDMTDLTMAERELRRHRDHLEELVRERTLALERSYAELRTMEALRDSLVHMVVHDLRSPLSSVLLGLEMLIEDLASQIGADDLERLEAALASVEALGRMTNDMLDVSRMEGDRMPMAPARHDLAALAEAALRNLGGMARTRDVRPSLASTDTLCDGELIRRVIENIVSNGIKHTPPDKPLFVGVVRADGVDRVEVRDEGPGIPEAARSKIFDKFATLTTTGDRLYHSAGLGLTFCKMVVEAHGGRIGVDSRVGHGSTFWFTLPGTPPAGSGQDA